MRPPRPESAAVGRWRGDDAVKLDAVTQTLGDHLVENARPIVPSLAFTYLVMGEIDHAQYSRFLAEEQEREARLRARRFGMRGIRQRILVFALRLLARLILTRERWLAWRIDWAQTREQRTLQAAAVLPRFIQLYVH